MLFSTFYLSFAIYFKTSWSMLNSHLSSKWLRAWGHGHSSEQQNSLGQHRWVRGEEGRISYGCYRAKGCRGTCEYPRAVEVWNSTEGVLDRKVFRNNMRIAEDSRTQLCAFHTRVWMCNGEVLLPVHSSRCMWEPGLQDMLQHLTPSILNMLWATQSVLSNGQFLTLCHPCFWGPLSPFVQYHNDFRKNRGCKEFYGQLRTCLAGDQIYWRSEFKVY